MASPLGSKVPLLVVAALSITALVQTNIDSIKEDISYDAGSQIIQNEIYFSNPTTKPESCFNTGSGAFLCHDKKLLSASGAYFFTAELQNQALSGAIIHRTAVMCNGKTTAQPVYVAHDTFLNNGSGGNVLWGGDSFSEGTVVTHIATGSTVKWFKDNYLTAVTGSSAVAISANDGDCQLEVWYSEAYGS